MIRDDASERQVRAADPDASTWLSANAGSGKTRVLTDRVARLLLGANSPDSAGTEPHRILCLTYTKAAASEMQNRLFRRLGAWAMMGADVLRDQLRGLGVEGHIDDSTLSRARRLFARAIETPGGLKIQTIHSFCASLLRRFPLEAGVSPQFTEMDGRTGELLRAEIIEDMADTRAPGVIARLASLYTGEDFAGLAEEVAKSGSEFTPPKDRAAIWRTFGLTPETSAAQILGSVFLGGEAEWIPQVAQILAAGSANDVKLAEKVGKLALMSPRFHDLAAFEDVFLYGKSKVEGRSFTAKTGALGTRATQARLEPLLDQLEPFMARVEAARTTRIALVAAEKTHALHEFAASFLPEYAKRKALRGWLDFDDLILRARDLLTNPSVAQWVLFRL
ncbi:MAG: UvrD-helicase domain-containing protein, partial [Gemmobacter sp.]|nr:UvrD-helicase domain-containing protein [Gemmobacter sp.]